VAHLYFLEEFSIRFSNAKSAADCGLVTRFSLFFFDKRIGIVMLLQWTARQGHYKVLSCFVGSAFCSLMAMFPIPFDKSKRCWL
jgi:hypothetical protein